MRGSGGVRGILAVAIAAAFVASSLAAAGPARASDTSAKIDPSLRAGEVALVRTTAGHAGALSTSLIELGATDVHAAPAADTVVARLSADALAALARDGRVALATRDIPITALGRGDDKDKDEDEDVLKDDSAGILAVGAPYAWRTSTGKGVAVALMDSGIAQHPDLPRGTVVARIDFVGDGASALDPAGHGTHIAGLVAASGERFKGMAPDAKLVSLRVLGANGTGRLASIVRAVDWLLRHGDRANIRVVNLAWGAPQATSYHQDLLSALVESVWFSGIAVVAAAGNGHSAGTITTPGSDPFVITVGSLDDQGTADRADDRESSFSSRGPTRDGFVKPDVLAPGNHVKSLRAAWTPENRYIRMSGTSASTGFVSGAVALVASAKRTYGPTQLKGAIVGGGRAVAGSTTPALDAQRSLTATARVNVGLIPSRLLTTFLSSLRLHGHGVTWEGVTWEGVTWEAVTWEAVTWEAVSWESVSWESVSWESVSWETVSWEGVTWNKVIAD